MLMTYCVFLAHFQFPVLNGVKYGLLLFRPMQASQVSHKHSLIKQLIWIQFIISCRVHTGHGKTWKAMEFMNFISRPGESRNLIVGP